MIHFTVQEALKRKLKARMEYAKFLQDTAKEMAKEVQTSRSGDIKQTAEDLDEFLNKVYILSMLQSLL
jgi:LETM1 and EF-hand domain-containing protein 1